MVNPALNLLCKVVQVRICFNTKDRHYGDLFSIIKNLSIILYGVDEVGVHLSCFNNLYSFNCLFFIFHLQCDV